MASPLLDQIVPVPAITRDQHDSLTLHDASPPDPAQPDQSFSVSVMAEGERRLAACLHRAGRHPAYPLPMSLVCMSRDAQMLVSQINGDQLLSR